MAVDTATKRASLLHLVLPDGTISAGDRLTLARLYSGIAAGEPAVAAPSHSALGRFEAQHNLAGKFGARHLMRGIF